MHTCLWKLIFMHRLFLPVHACRQLLQPRPPAIAAGAATTTAAATTSTTSVADAGIRQSGQTPALCAQCCLWSTGALPLAFVPTVASIASAGVRMQALRYPMSALPETFFDYIKYVAY